MAGKHISRKKLERIIDTLEAGYQYMVDYGTDDPLYWHGSAWVKIAAADLMDLGIRCRIFSTANDLRASAHFDRERAKKMQTAA